MARGSGDEDPHRRQKEGGEERGLGGELGDHRTEDDERKPTPRP